MATVPSPSPQEPPNHACLSCQFLWMKADRFSRLLAGLKPVPPPASFSASPAALPPTAQTALLQMQLDIQRSQVESQYGPETPTGWKRWAAALGLPVSAEEGPTEEGPGFVWPLSAVLIVAGFWGFSNIDQTAAIFGFVPERFSRGFGLTFLTSFFVHGGWVHLLSNLYFLMVFDRRVEFALGAGKNLVLLLGAAAAGCLAHLFFDPRPDVPLIGASGGISGAMMFYALHFRRSRFWFFLAGRWMRLPALAFIGIWIVLQFKGAALQHWGYSSVSAFAHLGGAAAGGLFWWAWGRSKPSE